MHSYWIVWFLLGMALIGIGALSIPLCSGKYLRNTTPDNLNWLSLWGVALGFASLCGGLVLVYWALPL